MEVQLQRRDLPESPGKRLLCECQMRPRHLGEFSWVVYCLPDGSTVLYDSKERVYQLTTPESEKFRHFQNAAELVACLNEDAE